MKKNKKTYYLEYRQRSCKKKSVIKILKGQNTRIYKNKRTHECPKIFKKIDILIGYHKNIN